MIRVYICPVIGTGVKGDPYRSKAHDFGFTHVASFIPSNADGTPASAWALSAIVASDFTAIDADTTCDDLFGGNLPSTLQTKADILAYLRANTVGSVPVTRRKAIQAVLDKYGVVRSDFTNATILWKVMQRVASTLFGKDFNETRTQATMESDDNFAAAF